jgi:hypothetical protein
MVCEIGLISVTGMLEIATRFFGVSTVIVIVALRAGSSQHGRNRRA